MVVVQVGNEEFVCSQEYVSTNFEVL